MSTLAPTRPQMFPVILIAAWFIAAFLLAAGGVFDGPASEPPWRLGLAIVVPIAGVGLALLLSPAFRAWTRSLDLQLLIQLQAWRLGGFAFIALSANHLLAESFAIPAALGDAAIAVTAPFMARHVASRGATPLFYAWTAFGILDLAAAVALGILNAPGPWGLLVDQGPTTELVGTMPVVLIPTFGVPLMIVLHLLSLARIRST